VNLEAVAARGSWIPIDGEHDRTRWHDARLNSGGGNHKERATLSRRGCRIIRR